MDYLLLLSFCYCLTYFVQLCKCDPKIKIFYIVNPVLKCHVTTLQRGDDNSECGGKVQNGHAGLCRCDNYTVV